MKHKRHLNLLVGVLSLLLLLCLVSVSEAFCIYKATPPPLLDGKSADILCDQYGNTQISKPNPDAGEDVLNDVQKVEQRLGYVNIVLAAPTTTTLKNGAGVLHTIVINQAAATGVITCYDNTAASGTVIATITQPATLLQSFASLSYDVAFLLGLTCVTSTAAQNITVSLR